MAGHGPRAGNESFSAAEEQGHMPAPGRTPLARLHDTARQAGIIVVDAVDDGGPLLDDDTAAFVACGVCIALNPGLDDGLRTDVLAMALALTCTMRPGKTDHAGDITAADGLVLISRTREAEPVSALGLLATVIAHEHGRGTASAAFEYTLSVFELPGTLPRAPRWLWLAGRFFAVCCHAAPRALTPELGPGLECPQADDRHGEPRMPTAALPGF